MKKLFVILFLLISINGYSQVHFGKFFAESQWRDSTLASGKHQLTFKADSSLRLLGYVVIPYAIQGNVDITGVYKLNGTTIQNIIDTSKYFSTYNFDTLKNFYRRDTIGYFNRYNLDTTRFLDLSDTSSIAHTTTGTETFSNIVKFITNVVDFAAGITTTTGVFSSVATFQSDVVFSGWVKNQSATARDQYEKITVIRVPLPYTWGAAYTATTFTAAHNLANWRTVTSWNCVVHEDSLNLNVLPNVYPTAGQTTNNLYQVCFIDSLNCNIRIPAAALNLLNDTAVFRIIWSDISR